MRFYESQTLERIGFDFYCDIANNIVKARQSKSLTQKELAEKAKIKYARLRGIEEMKLRLDLDDLEKLAEVLEVTIDWLIDAEFDSQVGECRYLVWSESSTDFKIYQDASSKRMAFLLFDQALKKARVKYNSPRERVFVELVGIPVAERDFQSEFSKRTEEDLPLEPDEHKVG